MCRSISLLAAAMLVVSAGRTAGQTPPVDVSSYFHALPTGVGARAWGMGGTQIALADSADASSWNPAAPAGLDRAVAFGDFSWNRLTGDQNPVRYALPTGHTGSMTPGRATASGARLGALQLACPFRLAGRRLVASLAYRRRLSLPSRTTAASLFRSQSLYRFDYDYSYEASGAGGFDTIGLSVASNLGRGIRVGATVHRWFGTLSASYVESYHYSVANYYGWTGSWNEHLGDDVRIEMSGYSVDVGAQLAAGDKYFAGIVFRSGTKADIDYSNAAGYEDTHTAQTTSARYAGRGTLALPSSVGLGIAVRLMPQLTLAVDHARVFWSGATLAGYTRINALGDVPQAVGLAYPTQTAVDLKAQSDAARSSAGVEYTLNAGRIQIQLRAGAAYQQAYDNAGGNSVAVCAGGGVRWGGFFLDAAWVRETASGRYARQSLTSSIGRKF